MNLAKTNVGSFDILYAERQTEREMLSLKHIKHNVIVHSGYFIDEIARGSFFFF